LLQLKNAWIAEAGLYKIESYFITKTKQSATFTLDKETVVEKTNSSFAYEKI
jgi:beta-glucosidase